MKPKIRHILGLSGGKDSSALVILHAGQSAGDGASLIVGFAKEQSVKNVQGRDYSEI